jgi:hypothetical protein
MVCNGNQKCKGYNTLGLKYANVLDTVSECLFWSIVFKGVLIAIGADVSNAFAEAPFPKESEYGWSEQCNTRTS